MAKFSSEIPNDLLKQIGGLADGGADEMIDDKGNVMTAHSLNDVPLVNISADPLPLKDGGKLCDIAPTLLKLMGLEIPAEMTGKPLV